MSVFLDNARQLFDVARADPAGEDLEFSLVVRQDGGLHLYMESALNSADSFAQQGRTAYRVTRNSGSVRVEGANGEQSCLLEARSARAACKALLNDFAGYRIISPLLTSGTS